MVGNNTIKQKKISDGVLIKTHNTQRLLSIEKDALRSTISQSV